MPRLPSITALIRTSKPPVGKRILVQEIRQSSGKQYWSVGTPFVSKKGRLCMGAEGTSFLLMLSKKTRWIPLPKEKLTPQGIEWYGPKKIKPE